MNSKAKNFWQAFGTHVGLGLVTVILFYVLAAFVVGPMACNRTGDIIVPDVVGMTQEEAQAIIADKGLEVTVEPAKVDSNYPEGFIAEQDPVSGMRVKPGRTIKLSLSAGISELHMPNLVAYKNDATPTTDSYTTLDRARITLNRMGLVLESTESRFDNNVPKDCVIDQTPAPRTSVKRGTKVVLLISKGPEEATVIVPSFIGSTPTDAGKQLKDLGLTVGTVTEVPRADVPSGRIVNQYPPVGTMLKRGEKVNFEISRNVSVAPPKPK